MLYQTHTARKPPSACTLVTPITPRLRGNGPVCCWLTSFAACSAHLTRHCQWGWCSSFSGFVHGDHDLWPWHSNSSDRGTKHVLRVNLAHICSVVPDILEAQKKQIETRTKDIWPNIHCTSSQKSKVPITMCSRHPFPRQPRNGPICYCTLFATYGALLTVHCLLEWCIQFFQFCTWWPWPLTLTFKLVQARDQSRLLCEFSTNAFSGSGDIWGTNKQRSHRWR